MKDISNIGISQWIGFPLSSVPYDLHDSMLLSADKDAALTTHYLADHLVNGLHHFFYFLSSSLFMTSLFFFLLFNVGALEATALVNRASDKQYGWGWGHKMALQLFKHSIFLCTQNTLVLPLWWNPIFRSPYSISFHPLVFPFKTFPISISKISCAFAPVVTFVIRSSVKLPRDHCYECHNFVE